ncbi:hypothetical protein V5F32_05135 [Xanthobacter oligotrophicus]|uniref:Uncharacterized protein n=1 Tax=Xanthobacter oligotrophicus TaxID=2607286 RepID=A0ABW6ZSY5_9HYPH
MAIRFPVEPRDIPPDKAARRLHLSLPEFEAARPRLERRGFPPPDPDTGMYDLKAIDAWMDRRSHLTAPAAARDAREGALARIANL